MLCLPRVRAQACDSNYTSGGPLWGRKGDTEEGASPPSFNILSFDGVYTLMMTSVEVKISNCSNLICVACFDNASLLMRNDVLTGVITHE